MTKAVNRPRHAGSARSRRSTVARTAVGALAIAVLGAGVGVGAGTLLDDDNSAEVGLAGVDGGPAPVAPSTAAPTSESTSTTTGPTTMPTTTAPPTTVAPTTAPPTTEPDDGTLSAGDDGAEVAALQTRLVELGYWLGEPDGNYGSITAQAVLAFQKAEGLSRDGIAGPATQAALVGAGRPAPREGGGGLRIEVDLERQIMFLVSENQTTWVLNTSTGTDSTPTPPGTFSITREIDGLREAPLGQLWRPKYFNGGIALHGSNSIPGGPASHGCTRLSNAAMDMIWASGAAPVGTTVVVY